MKAKSKSAIKKIKENFQNYFKTPISEQLLLKIIQHEIHQRKIVFLKTQLSHLELNNKDLADLATDLSSKVCNHNKQTQNLKKKISSRSKINLKSKKKDQTNKVSKSLLGLENQPLLISENV